MSSDSDKKGFRAPYDEAIAAITQPGSPYELGQESINGVDYTVFVNAPKTMVELIDAGRQFGDQEFLVYQDERWTFNEFFLQVDKLSHQLLHQLGVTQGDRVAIAMRNYPEWMTAFVAIISVGAVAVPLNSWGLSQELEQGLVDAETRFLFCDQQRLDLIDTARLNLKTIVVRPEAAEFADDVQSYDSLVAEAPEKTERPVVSIDAEDMGMILYTSGTSGRPKGGVFTHRSICQSIINFEAGGAASYMTNLEAFQALMKPGMQPKSLMAVPLFHVSGLLAQLLLNIRSGRGIVMMYKWSVPEACKLIENERVTMIAAAPSMLLELLSAEEFLKIDSSCLINLSGAGAASPPKLTATIREKLPATLTGAGWGMTETGAAGCSFVGYFMQEKPHVCGFVNPVVELRFCDENGEEVPDGSPGEIWLKSPTNISGYWKKEEANKSEFSNGWFKTGDIGFLDEDGCMNICDRVKDIVIRGGENIYPVEIENCIQSCPGVVRAVAFGVPSDKLGEELVMVVRVEKNVESTGELTEAIIKQFCRDRLASFKVPSVVKITESELPVNATNKVLKKQVRDDFLKHVNDDSIR